MDKDVSGVKSVLIIGLGLMGGSFAKMIKLKMPEIHMIGVDTSYCNESNFDDGTSPDFVSNPVNNISTVDYALQNGIIDEGSMDLDSINFENIDIIILGTPLYTYDMIIKSIMDRVKSHTIITDIGSVKEKPQSEITGLLRGRSTFIGGHPMRGSDKSGIQNADEKIYDNTVFFLTPTIDEDDEIQESVKIKLDILDDFLKKVGLQTHIVAAKVHDRFVAKTSHVPHIAAAFLVDGISDAGMKSYKFIADGFKDTTRIAASNPTLWTDIFFANRSSVIDELNSMKSNIDFFIDCLERDAPDDMRSYLDKTSKLRKMLNTMIIKGEK